MASRHRLAPGLSFRRHDAVILMLNDNGNTKELGRVEASESQEPTGVPNAACSLTHKGATVVASRRLHDRSGAAGGRALAPSI
jgi:hypothetical protein